MTWRSPDDLSWREWFRCTFLHWRCHVSRFDIHHGVLVVRLRCPRLRVEWIDVPPR